MPTTLRPQAQIVGRDGELRKLHGLSEADGPRALVLCGEPGIGKTTLWDAGVEAARGHGLRVLSCRASGADAQLAYAGLIDLLDTV